MKYLPYPPLQRMVFGCPDCSVTVTVYSYYPQAAGARAEHRCLRTLRVKSLIRR